MKGGNATGAWVRWVDGRFVLTWAGGERPLTLGERVLFRLFARTPKP